MADKKPEVPAYSQRVPLKNILGRRDGGFGMRGTRVVIGGWVKSAKELRKEPVRPHSKETKIPGGFDKVVSCVDTSRSQIPICRSLMKVLPEMKIKPVEVSQPILITISDGSCVANLRIVVKSSLPLLRRTCHSPTGTCSSAEGASKQPSTAAESSITLPSRPCPFPNGPCLLAEKPLTTLDSSSTLQPGDFPVGTCISAEGTLKRPANPGKHLIELVVEKIFLEGTVEKEYPLSTKPVPFKSLRDFSHFSPRTTTVGSVIRIQSAINFSVHSFFQNNCFLHVQLPTITTTRAEGFGEKFVVATLGRKEANEQHSDPNKVEGQDLDDSKSPATEKSEVVEELKRTDNNKDPLVTKDLEKTNEPVSTPEAREKSKYEPSSDDMKLSEDFFSQRTYLTASGRLHLESYSCALGNVYSCGPRFRADRIQSSKQCAEMWMVETEIAFAQMEDAIKRAYELLKFVCERVLKDCYEDMSFLMNHIDKCNIARLQLITQSTSLSLLKRISYNEAMDIFEKVADRYSNMKLELGAALTTEQLSYLADKHYNKPLIIFNYPKEAQPFYVRQNDDGKTVATFDLILPKAGRVISGSQIEERLDKLQKRIQELKLPENEYEWYSQLRRHGTVEHSGFSLNLDSFLVFATGLPEIREAIPFSCSYREVKNSDS